MPFPRTFQKLASDALKGIPLEDRLKQIGKEVLEGESEDFQLKEVLLIDNQWEVEITHKINRVHFNLNTNNRVMSLKVVGKSVRPWKYKFTKAIQNSVMSPMLDRFVQDGFAPTRKGNRTRIMVDGEQYFRILWEELQKAQTEIFITDWWLCPKYYLKKPVCLNNPEDDAKYRLDQILKEAVCSLFFSFL